MSAPKSPYIYLNRPAPIITELATHIYESTRATLPTLWIGRGYDPGPDEHGTKRAVDLIVSRKVGLRPTAVEFMAGEQLAAWLVKNARALNVRHLIWNKKIFRQRRANEGWQPLPGRNSKSSISDWHIDHIHVLLENTNGYVPKTPISSMPVKPSPKPTARPLRPFAIGNLFTAIRTGRYDGNTTTVQAALKMRGFDCGRADGIFGRKTIAAYAAFQRSLGYRGKDADGVPGRTSLANLLTPHGYKII